MIKDITRNVDSKRKVRPVGKVKMGVSVIKIEKKEVPPGNREFIDDTLGNKILYITHSIGGTPKQLEVIRENNDSYFVRVEKGTEKSFPSSVSFFVLPDKLEKIYGKRPTEVNVIFDSPVDIDENGDLVPDKNLERIIPNDHAEFKAGGLICKGNGEVAFRKNEKGEWMKRDCLCPLSKHFPKEELIMEIMNTEVPPNHKRQRTVERKIKGKKQEVEISEVYVQNVWREIKEIVPQGDAKLLKLEELKTTCDIRFGLNFLVPDAGIEPYTFHGGGNANLMDLLHGIRTVRNMYGRVEYIPLIFSVRMDSRKTPEGKTFTYPALSLNINFSALKHLQSKFSEESVVTEEQKALPAVQVEEAQFSYEDPETEEESEE